MNSMKFEMCVCEMAAQAKQITINGKQVRISREGITGMEVAAITAAALGGAALLAWAGTVIAARSHVGRVAAVNVGDEVLYDVVSDYNMWGAIGVAGQWVNLAAAYSRGIASLDHEGNLVINCPEGVEKVVKNALLEAFSAKPAPARKPAKPAPAPKAEKPASKPKAEKPASKPAAKAEKPKASPEVAARHKAEEKYIAAVLAAEALGAGLPEGFTELAGALLALACARDEGAPATTFAPLNRARGAALAAVRSHGPSGVAEVDAAFRKLEAAAKAAQAARAAARAA